MENDSDRLYWTIGVILIGAALVAAALALFPDLFKSVGEKLKSMMSNVGDPGSTPAGGAIDLVKAVGLKTAMITLLG